MRNIDIILAVLDGLVIANGYVPNYDVHQSCQSSPVRT